MQPPFFSLFSSILENVFNPLNLGRDPLGAGIAYSQSGFIDLGGILSEKIQQGANRAAAFAKQRRDELKLEEGPDPEMSLVAFANQGFSAFRTELNNILGALNTAHIGSSAPASVAQGTIWVDSGTSGVLKVKINDGSDNVELFQINISSNAITSTMSVTGTISETDPNALPLAIALG